ncbi:MAG TPA: hypothetical protein ENK18_27910 [Deltaproteobacteria bacterium]|nr:hypothetical protein [Deltaproteobacteria bacterium]
MPKITIASLVDHVANDVLLRVATLYNSSPLRRGPRFVDGPEDLQAEEPELELFMDWDNDRGHGRGAYTQDGDECRSRRVDLRGPTDADPGPLPMEEAPDDVTAQHLSLS